MGGPFNDGRGASGVLSEGSDSCRGRTEANFPIRPYSTLSGLGTQEPFALTWLTPLPDDGSMGCRHYPSLLHSFWGRP